MPFHYVLASMPLPKYVGIIDKVQPSSGGANVAVTGLGLDPLVSPWIKDKSELRKAF
jgi:hypothetical protein